MYAFCLVSLFNAISTSPVEEQKWYHLTYNWENIVLHTFPKDKSPKGNIIARLEFELTYFEVAVKHVSH